MVFYKILSFSLFKTIFNALLIVFSVTLLKQVFFSLQIFKTTGIGNCILLIVFYIIYNFVFFFFCFKYICGMLRFHALNSWLITFYLCFFLFYVSVAFVAGSLCCMNCTVFAVLFLFFQFVTTSYCTWRFVRICCIYKFNFFILF